MVTRLQRKLEEDFETIYSKYCRPFTGAPEVTLSTCELPENVKLIERYSRFNSSPCKSVVGSNDEESDDNSDVSDSGSSGFSSDCSGSFKRGEGLSINHLTTRNKYSDEIIGRKYSLKKKGNSGCKEKGFD
ncbi:uncharacterized protein LOC124437386 isoform X3 [Xenia sp. Carnegie-2017]|uniref:uncharacterized protein LOC124437386 isoform X3 n=1 Tax=Xenia sp. Carnegie-2017 TaxID=2897299 RepID=UPI001F04C430|nr:uncharacterized protein LOC124437386 isoform X3 [Xenia sp. Carnegie-2017]